MSFLDEVSPAQKVGTVLGVIVLGLAMRMVLAGGIEEYFNPAKRVENHLVAALEQQPGDMLILQAMERYFPHDYEDLLDAMTDVAVDGADEDMVSQAGRDQLIAFMHRHRNDFAAAPSASLVAALDAELALLEHLQREDAGECSAYAFGFGLFEGEPSPTSLELTGAAVSARVAAMAAGRRDQQLRLHVTPAVVRNLAEDMQAMGASEVDVVIALEGSEDYMVDDAQRCTIAITALRAISQQPAEDRDLLIGQYLMVG